MSISIRPMTINDYEEVFDLWKTSEGIGLSSADEKESIANYLVRNPGFSYVAMDNGSIVGAVLCGHDGRRGLLHHLAIKQSHRRQGTGAKLVNLALEKLSEAGIQKCHIFVYEDNLLGQAFWENMGWMPRRDLMIMSHDTKGR